MALRPSTNALVDGQVCRPAVKRTALARRAARRARRRTFDALLRPRLRGARARPARRRRRLRALAPQRGRDAGGWTLAAGGSRARRCSAGAAFGRSGAGSGLPEKRTLIEPRDRHAGEQHGDQAPALGARARRPAPDAEQWSVKRRRRVEREARCWTDGNRGTRRRCRAAAPDARSAPGLGCEAAASGASGVGGGRDGGTLGNLRVHSSRAAKVRVTIGPGGVPWASGTSRRAGASAGLPGCAACPAGPRLPSPTSQGSSVANAAESCAPARPAPGDVAEIRAFQELAQRSRELFGARRPLRRISSHRGRDQRAQRREPRHRRRRAAAGVVESAFSLSPAVARRKGGLPVHASISSAPTANTSVAGVSALAAQLLGRHVAGRAEHLTRWLRRTGVAGAAMPKSIRRTAPSSSNITLRGVTSR